MGHLFFYNNGIIECGSSFSSSEIIQKENEFKDGSYYTFSSKSKYCWGVFHIDGNGIKFERWYLGDGLTLKAYVREGTILNDTTFIITESYRFVRGKKKKKSAEDETYHFKALNPKPDSTNKFVK